MTEQHPLRRLLRDCRATDGGCLVCRVIWRFSGKHDDDCMVPVIEALLDAGKLGERVECEVCGGSGKVNGYGMYYSPPDCATCHGTGGLWRVIE